MIFELNKLVVQSSFFDEMKSNVQGATTRGPVEACYSVGETFIVCKPTLILMRSVCCVFVVFFFFFGIVPLYLQSLE